MRIFFLQNNPTPPQYKNGRFLSFICKHLDSLMFVEIPSTCRSKVNCALKYNEFKKNYSLPVHKVGITASGSPDLSLVPWRSS